MDLFSAVALGDEKQVARILSQKPSSANACNSRGFPAVDQAIAMNYVDVVKRLLDSGCDLEIANRCDGVGEKGGTPLHEAAFRGHFAIAKELVARGANVNATSRKRWTPLHSAAYTHSSDIVRLLLEKSARADAENSDGETPLALARQNRSGDADEVEAVFAEFQKKNKPPGK